MRMQGDIDFVEINFERTPIMYHLDSSGTYQVRSDCTYQLITSTPIWVSSVERDIFTSELTAILAYLKPDGQLATLSIPSDTFLSYSRVRSRILNRTGIEIENYSLTAFLHYLRLAGRVCPEHFLTGVEGFMYGNDSIEAVGMEA